MPLITVRGPKGPPVTHRFDQDVITVGRSPRNDLMVRDPALSRLHVEIRWEGGNWVVADRESRNGSLLNGRRLRRTEPLLPGDEIALGETRLVFDAPVEGAVAESIDTETAPAGWSARGTGKLAEADEIVAESPAMRSVLETADTVARSGSTVLLLGENGTGKELLARRIHARSPRAGGPFVVVNCPALAPGLVEAELFGVEKGVATGVEPRVGRLESAAGGTLFLDEVGDLDLAAQAKLLRFLQDRKLERIGGREERSVDLRLVAATNHDLEGAIARGAFRRDLYHRIAVVVLTLPPLRVRREDIPPLVEHFLARHGERAPLAMSEEAMALLRRYDWPGNVRELEHVLERAAVLAKGPAVEPRDLPEALVREPAPTPTSTPLAPIPSAAGSPPVAPVEAQPATPERVAADLFRRIVEGGESFWDVVHRPFLTRELSKDDVRKLIEHAWREAGGSYKKIARRFGIESEYKRLVNFLHNHDLRLRD